MYRVYYVVCVTRALISFLMSLLSDGDGCHATDDKFFVLMSQREGPPESPASQVTGNPCWARESMMTCQVCLLIQNSVHAHLMFVSSFNVCRVAVPLHRWCQSVCLRKRLLQTDLCWGNNSRFSQQSLQSRQGWDMSFDVNVLFDVALLCEILSFVIKRNRKCLDYER